MTEPVALADKNTYWNILKSPFSERTQHLATEGKLAQAMGRGAGEMSVEAGQEVAETVATGGVGKVGMVVVGFTVDASKVAGRTVKIADTVGDYSRLPKSVLKRVKHTNASYNIKADTSRFAENGLQHLFDGEINKKGKAVGFHQVRDGSAGKIVPGTKVPHPKAKTNPAYEGVYSAEVEVWGYKKKARSTMYPDDWSKEDIVNRVNEAYDSKKQLKGNLYEGTTKDGLSIRMRLDGNGVIETAYIY